MKISAAELQAGALNDDNLKVAARTLKECGFVVLEDAVPRDWIEQTRQVCDETLERYMQTVSPEKRAFYQHTHAAMFPPRCSPFMDAVAIENAVAVQVTQAVLGPDFFCTFYNTNTQWPHSGIQDVHRDYEHLFPELPIALPVMQLAVNILLVDFTLENGATEVWPGSHLIVDGCPKDGEELAERAALLPSVRTTAPAGSIILRDMRTWHRGMPNQTNAIRTMLAFVYNRPFLNTYISASELIEIPLVVWEDMSERAKHIFRFNPIVDRAPSRDGTPPPY